MTTQARSLTDETLSHLLGCVTAELNNVLTVVLGQATLLAKDQNGETRSLRAGTIARAAERGATLLRDVLILAGHRRPRPLRLSLNDIIEEGIGRLGAEVRSLGIDLGLALAPDMPPVAADPILLRDVVGRLVVMAVEALRGMPLPRRLRIRSWYDGATGRDAFEITDSGPRIAYRQPLTGGWPAGGEEDLGLALCRAIVQGHGGTIHVESQPDSGTVCRVELPVARSTLAAEPQRTAARPRGTGPGKSILIVDDQPEIAALLAAVLARDGHRVETVANGRIALERLTSATFDLILSDLDMPELDGRGLVLEVSRCRPDLTDRVVLMTGNPAGVTAVADALRLRVLYKPFGFDELRQMVREIAA